MSRPARIGWILGSALVPLVLPACGGDDDEVSPDVTAPPALSVCVDPGDAAAEASCLDQIERFIEADVGGVEQAIDRVVETLSRASSVSYEFQRVTTPGDGYDPADPEAAIELHWQVGTTDRTMFLCAAGETYEVGPDPCGG